MIDPAIIAAAQASHKRFWPRGPFVSVSLAQYALESAWGTKLSGHYNFFGMKATQDEIESGDVTWDVTREETKSGASYYIRAAFRNFTSLEDAFDAHATLLTSSRYIDCMKAHTADEYCDALAKDGYATAHTYAATLKNIIHTCELTCYDEVF